ncbi:MAG: hypothetical protein B7X08_04570 [Acidocella sp. 20-63-7]|nr:MAG: hypothetical protein B7X08_04570 [Acidocella sp. 20-63-7]HQT46336.1 tetratricopeptide repeat protein [Acidocella sp.]
MVDIFDEVTEDLRTEQAIKLARRYGGLLIGAMVLVLAGVGGQQAYSWYQTRQNDKAATTFLALTRTVDNPAASAAQAKTAAAALANFAVNAPEGYKTLANLRAAGLYAANGQADEAEALWTGISDDSAAAPLLRGLATLLWAQHALGTAPDADVLARLKPLTNSQSPYHGLAQEIQALLYLNEGKTDLAKALLSQIASDPNAPDGVRNRADGLLAKLNG